MTSGFYEIDTVFQIILLVLSLLAVIILGGGCVLFFRHKLSRARLAAMTVLLLLNSAFYVLMQLDSRITAAGQEVHADVPYAVPLLVILLSLVFALWSILRETGKRDRINSTSIKEAFDNLPTGVCFFNEAGLPVLCNRAMHRFSFAVCGKDVQYIADLQDCLAEDFAPVNGTTKDGKIFTMPDGSAKTLEKRGIAHKDGALYTQYIALDVTDLQKKREELQTENAQLRKVQAELARLSANVVTITREEEILNTKMRVHDEMGRCLTAAGKYLREHTGAGVPESVVRSWQRAVSMLKYNNETGEEDMLLQIRRTCESVNLGFLQKGELPREQDAAYILTCAVRECVTNAVRYAEASELYAEFSETESLAEVVVTNNGVPPEGEIVEGGGLSNLRRRVERAGGVMTVQSLPEFKLTVVVPKRKEGVL